MSVRYADSGQGWVVDERFYKFAPSHISTVSGRQYYTLSTGSVIFCTVYMSATGWTGPVVISTKRELAAYDPGGIVSQGSFDYLGFTWYITAFGYWFSGNQADTSGISQKLELEEATYDAVGKAILIAASVLPADYAETTTTKIYYNGNSKVIRHLCQIINNVAKLGTTHTTAFYGDLGMTAYEHSQRVSGNPHNVSLAELGIENVPRQITMILDTIGSLDQWICHGDRAEFIDHEGDQLVFVSGSNLLAWH